jgi:hypothetical protein
LWLQSIEMAVIESSFGPRKWGEDVAVCFGEVSSGDKERPAEYLGGSGESPAVMVVGRKSFFCWAGAVPKGITRAATNTLPYFMPSPAHR